MKALAYSKPWLVNWLQHLSKFLVGQLFLQAISLFIGFCLLRWLDKEAYAQYSMAFAFQTTAQMFIEFGFSTAIVALVGSNINDKELIGNYIKAGKSFRLKTYFVIGIACCIIFPILAIRQHWPISVIILLLLSILSNLYFTGWISYYKPPFQIHKKIGTIYKTEVGSNLFRGTMIYAFYLASSLTSWIASFAMSLTILFNGVVYKKLATQFIVEPDKPSEQAKKEILTYIKPVIPGIIFGAFQSQITIFIISIFGKTAAIAEIGALYRLSQFFMFLNMAGSTIIAPYIARQKKQGLLKKYIYISIAATIVVILLDIVGFVYPNILLLFLGEKYNGLNAEVSLVVFDSGVIFLNTLLFGMNAARKWLFKWMPVINIPGILIIQVICVWFLDLSITYNVLLMAIFVSSFVLLMRIVVAIYGFVKVDNE